MGKKKEKKNYKKIRKPKHNSNHNNTQKRKDKLLNSSLPLLSDLNLRNV